MRTQTVETAEKNRLIAEFMNVKPNDKFYDGWELHKAGLPFAYGAMGNGTDHLPFGTSWDWLMPVVDKIESFGYWIELRTFTYGCRVYIGDYDFNTKLIVNVFNNTKLESTYKAVVEFIENFNEEKQKIS